MGEPDRILLSYQVPARPLVAMEVLEGGDGTDLLMVVLVEEGEVVKLLILVLPDLVRLYLKSGQRMVVMVDKHLFLGYASEAVERGCMGFDYTAHMEALHNLDSNLKVVPGHMSRNFAVVVEEKDYVVRNNFVLPR